MNFERRSTGTVFKNSVVLRFNLLQFCQSGRSFVFAVLFKPSLNVLSVYLCVTLSLVASS